MSDGLDRGRRATPGRSGCRCQWAGRGATAWALLFAAPHLWWALGIPAGFPGGPAGLEAALTVPWFRTYDLLVVALCDAAALVAAVAVRRLSAAILVTWGIGGVLLARGLAGLAVDGLADPAWSLAFVVGGLLFGVTAWQCGRSGPGLPRRSEEGTDGSADMVE